MQWRTVPITQNGNTDLIYILIDFSGMSSHDAVVVGPTIGSSIVEITRVAVRLSPIRYIVTVRVVGPGAMAFRIHGERVDDAFS